jgi:GNAT superfamily N-acetyltransferase
MTTSGPAAAEGCRPATSDDLPRIAELAAGAVAELRVGRGGEMWARTLGRREPFEPRLAEELASPDHHVLVGTLDETILGYGVVRVDRLSDDGLLGVVTDLYVEPEARAVGIGELTMDALVGWCREQGCFGVDSLALPGDRHTKNFFESFGLVARAIVVHRSLG